jgi:hypothetical protein
MIKEKIKFLEDRTVESQGRVVNEFKAGEVYELPAPSARRWIKRNVAEPVRERAPRVVEKKKPKGRPPKKKLTAAKEKPLTDYDLPGEPNRDQIAERTAPGESDG